MPMKRNRANNSSAYLDTAVSIAGSPTPVRLIKTDTETPQPKLLTVASPVNVAVDFDWTKFGGFLERCHYCKKRIAHNSEVFMYRNLCAFCSVECRDCRINLDQLAGKKF